MRAKEKELIATISLFFSVRCCQPCFLWKNRKGGRERDREGEEERERERGRKREREQVRI